MALTRREDAVKCANAYESLYLEYEGSMKVEPSLRDGMILSFGSALTGFPVTFRPSKPIWIAHSSS